MASAETATLNDMTQRLRQLLQACARGDLPPALTVAHVLVETKSVDAASGLLANLACEDGGLGDSGSARVEEVRRLLAQNRGPAMRVVEMLSGVDHEIRADTPDDGIAACRAMFDRAVTRSAEGSVALHSLGSAALLNRATAEIVDRLRSWDLLGANRRALDIGCGIGRFEAALSPEVAAITGIDISANMIAEARRRCTSLANVRLMQTDGRDLRQFAGSAFDLVLSVDAFPYLVQSGMALVETQFREIARVLKPGGDLVILNFAYRGDVEADRRDIGRLAAANGFKVIRNGTSDFRLWDGVSFVMKYQ